MFSVCPSSTQRKKKTRTILADPMESTNPIKTSHPYRMKQVPGGKIRGIIKSVRSIHGIESDMSRSGPDVNFFQLNIPNDTLNYPTSNIKRVHIQMQTNNKGSCQSIVKEKHTVDECIYTRKSSGHNFLAIDISRRQSLIYWGGLGLALADLRAPSLAPGETSRRGLLVGRPG